MTVSGSPTTPQAGKQKGKWASPEPTRAVLLGLLEF